MEKNLLTIQGLSAWYHKERNVLSDFSIELKQNEVVGLIGLNGAGKTTFIKTLSGLHETFRVEEVRMHDHAVKFRDNNFKISRYTVSVLYVPGVYGVRVCCLQAGKSGYRGVDTRISF